MRGNGRGAENLPNDGPKSASRASWNKACREEKERRETRAEKEHSHPLRHQRAASLSKVPEKREPACQPAAVRAVPPESHRSALSCDRLFVDDLHPAVIAREGDFVRAVCRAARAPGISGAPRRAGASGGRSAISILNARAR